MKKLYKDKIKYIFGVIGDILLKIFFVTIWISSIVFLTYVTFTKSIFYIIALIVTIISIVELFRGGYYTGDEILFFTSVTPSIIVSYDYIEPYITSFIMFIKEQYVNDRKYADLIVALLLPTIVLLIIALCILVNRNKELKEKMQPWDKQLTGNKLLNALLINGELANPFKNSFTNKEIHNALLELKHIFDISVSPASELPWSNNENKEKSLSQRQYYCAIATIKDISNNDYHSALHNFQDCIDNYGENKERVITRSEFILYSCILTCFIKNIENSI